MTEDKQLYEILIPRNSAQGTKYSLEHHQRFYNSIKSMNEDLTLLKLVDTEWNNHDGLIQINNMVPIRVYCTRDSLDNILKLSFEHYDQDSVMAYLISREVTLKYRPKK